MTCEQIYQMQLRWTLVRPLLDLLHPRLNHLKKPNVQVMILLGYLRLHFKVTVFIPTWLGVFVFFLKVQNRERHCSSKNSSQHNKVQSFQWRARRTLSFAWNKKYESIPLFIWLFFLTFLSFRQLQIAWCRLGTRSLKHVDVTRSACTASIPWITAWRQRRDLASSVRMTRHHARIALTFLL